MMRVLFISTCRIIVVVLFISTWTCIIVVIFIRKFRIIIVPCRLTQMLYESRRGKRVTLVDQFVQNRVNKVLKSGIVGIRNQEVSNTVKATVTERVPGEGEGPKESRTGKRFNKILLDGSGSGDDSINETGVCESSKVFTKAAGDHVGGET